MYPATRFWPANPVRIAAARRQLAIQRHGPLRRNIGALPTHKGSKRTNDFIRFFSNNAYRHLNSCRAQLRNPQLTDQWIGIERANNNTPDTCFNNSTGTWRCMNGHTTRLKRDVQIGPSCPLSCLVQRVYLGMWPIWRGGCTFTYNLSITHHNGSHRRTRSRPTFNRMCAGNSKAHRISIIHYFLLSKLP